jgi:dipeptidyl aminopeptidase/acylaminoacyl peptidase
MTNSPFPLLAVLALAAACSSGEKEAAPMAEAGQEPVSRYDAEAFFATTTYALASGYAWSQDDGRLLVSSDQSGIFNAVALTAADGAKQALTTSTTDSVFAVSWFPDDARVLYTADKGGNEINHLFVREISGETRDLTPGDEVKAEFAGWSEDRKHFHVLSNERDAASFDLYRYAVDGYERTLIFRNDEALEVSAISPDGSYVALVKPRTSADSDIYLLYVPEPDSAPTLITKHTGNVSHFVYDFTRDSSKLVYSTDEHGEFTQAWTYDLNDGTKAPLIAAEWDVMFVAFSESGRYRVSATNEDARTVIKILDSRSGDEVALPGLPPGDLAQIRFSRDESKLALLLSSDTSPSDVYTVSLAAGSAARLTEALNPQIDEADLVETAVVRYQSFDGVEVPGILYRPHGASTTEKAPALVWVHGGPGGQSRTGYSATIQHLVNHGYAVLAANNRGSSGYGKTFYHMDDRRHGDVDLKDIVYAKGYLASLDWVDAERVGIIGGSYGGYMVGAALAFEPDVFDVGINIFGDRRRAASPDISAVPRPEHQGAPSGRAGRQRPTCPSGGERRDRRSRASERGAGGIRPVPGRRPWLHEARKQDKGLGSLPRVSRHASARTASIAAVVVWPAWRQMAASSGAGRDRRPLSERPAARHRPVEPDQRHGGAGFALHETILGLELRALGVQHLQEVGHAAIEAQTRQASGFTPGRGRGLKMLTLPLQSGVAHQRILGLLERPQHRLLVAGEVLGRIGIRRRDARAHPAYVEERPVDSERDRACLAVALEQRVGIDRLRADETAEREARKQVGRRNTDPRRRGGEPALRGEDVRTTPQQFSGRTGRYVRGQSRKRCSHFEFRHERGGLAPRQHGDPVCCHSDFAFERRYERKGAFELAACLLDVQLCAAAGVKPRLHEFQRAALVIGIAARHVQLLLQSA